MHRRGTPGVVEHQHARQTREGRGYLHSQRDAQRLSGSSSARTATTAVLARRGPTSFGSSEGSAPSTRKLGWVAAENSWIRTVVNQKNAHLSSG